MPLYHEQVDAAEAGPAVVVAGSLAVELDWVVGAAWRPDFQRDHPTIGRLYAEAADLAERVRDLWGDAGAIQSGDEMELTILAHHAGILFSLDPAELLDPLEELCASAPRDLRLGSETPADRATLRHRLAQMRSSSTTRRRFAQLVREIWAGVAPDWRRYGLRSVETAVSRRRELQRRGAAWREVARGAYAPSGHLLDGLVRSLDAQGTIAVVPAYFAHLGSLIDLPGMVLIGVRADSGVAEVRARTESLARRLKTLSDPTRLAMLEVLSGSPSTVSELAELFHLAQPTVSNHVKLLRDAGVVANAGDGGRRGLVLNREAVQGLLGDLEAVLAAPATATPAGRSGPKRDTPESAPG
ncbi:MAG TPA: metalloregulator ArsR/SmtB family transcription factor [Candidatus Binatia bacterium]|nr:metalloregulator ArsR/SmtB family transcription factor [Candidatus Binatia bacterium]